jgi:HAD superfamily hydrolase (TIGR01509 family)
MDGTLVDNLELIVRSFNHAVAELVGREFSRQEVFSRFGPTLEEIVEDTVPVDCCRSAVARYHAHYRKFFHKYAHVYPGITELITGLKQVDIAVSVCTGSDQRMTQTTLEESGLQRMFSAVVTADDVREQKPDPGGLILTMRLVNAPAARTICLGDAPRDIEASKRAGIISAAVLWGFGKEETLRAQEPDYVFGSPFDALRILPSLG